MSKDEAPTTKAETKEPTPPTGQGGATPHDGISYQDKWPPNPQPDEAAKKAKAAETK